MEVVARDGTNGVVTETFKTFKHTGEGVLVKWTEAQSWWHRVDTGQFLRGKTAYKTDHHLDIMKILD